MVWSGNMPSGCVATRAQPCIAEGEARCSRGLLLIHAPMVGAVARAVLDDPELDAAEVAGARGRAAGLARHGRPAAPDANRPAPIESAREAVYGAMGHRGSRRRR